MKNNDRKINLRLLFAAPLASVSGLLFLTSFPAISWWPGALLGLAGFAVSVWNQKARHGLWLGTLFGGFFWLPLIDWLSLYLGPVPWLALSFLMILWNTLFGAAIAFVSSKLNALLSSFAFAGLWTVREIVQSNFPYDGFAWGRLAHTQADGPLLDLVAWLGFAGLSGLLALLAVIPVAFFMRNKSRFKSIAVALPAVVATILLLSFVPVPTLLDAGTTTIAGVQGNSKSGVFDNRENGDVFADHLRVTEEWIAANPEVANSTEAIIWPENSAEYNLPWQQDRVSKVRAIAEETGASIVVGSILGEEISGEMQYTNSSLVMQTGKNNIERYDKRYPVPFAEYMPHRAFYRSLAPDLVDMVQLEYQHGQTSTVLPVANMQAGFAICFDIIFDAHAAQMSKEGAQVIYAPTNNADFGRTDQSVQQLAIAKLRAVEMGRPLINISTVATSQIFSHDGTILASTTPWQPGVIAAEIELRDGLTPAMQFGSIISVVWMLIGLSLLIVAFITPRAARQQANVK